jgi:uncharacterized RDD family membrane protein YckC
MNNGRTLTSVLQELKDELRDFAVTRYDMLMNELRHKLAIWKLALPMVAVAALLGVTAFIVLTFAIIAVIAEGIGGTFSWFWGALIIGVFYILSASVFAWLGYRELQKEGITPNRTLRILKEDQVWLQEEARSA